MDDEISAAELRERLDRGEPIRIVDIRSPGAFARGHIPGSENVPFGEIPDRVETFEGADHVVTVCPHGKASVQAAKLIGSYEGTDATVESLSSGIEGWPYELEQEKRDEATEEAPF
ncbi:MAG: rhodanese-like domain-containing protein [Haloarculaceae archaeon]